MILCVKDDLQYHRSHCGDINMDISTYKNHIIVNILHTDRHFQIAVKISGVARGYTAQLQEHHIYTVI